MSDIALKVEGLGKRYRIGVEQGGAHRYKSLRDSLVGVARRPMRAVRSAVIREPMNESNSFWALKDIDFEVKRGEVIGIIGRNGAGKSTLLKILSQITKPTAGHVALYGRVGSLLEVGTGFHPELTGRENVHLNGAILGMTRAEVNAKFDEIVDFSEIERFLDTPVKHYSSGMYTRLAFAIAAHLEPEILVVDEVLAVGDAEFQRRCLGKMKDVAAQGRTVIFVSHNMGAIAALCDVGLLMAGGRSISHGEVNALIRKYLGEGALSSDGKVDLSRQHVRSPHTQPWLKSLRVFGGRGINTSRLSSSDRLVVTIVVDPPRAIHNPIVAIAVEDNYGRRITTMATNFTQLETGDFSSEFEATCEVDRIALGPGQYTMSVSIAEPEAGMLDSLDSVAWIDVEWDGAYPTGAPHHAVYGPVITTGRWKLSRL